MLGPTVHAHALTVRMLKDMRILKFTTILALLHGTACGPSMSPTGDGDPGTQTTESETTESETGEDEEPEPEQPEEPPFELGEDDLAEIIEVSHELEQIVAGAIAYFENSDPQRCPSPEGVPQGGEAGFTPMDFLNCNLGANQRCTPVSGNGSEAGHYPDIHWSDSSVWESIGWRRETDVPHAFHYNFRAVNLPEGSCTFTAEAIADFDNDFEFSSYSISGSLSQDGAVVGPLEIVDPFE